MGYERSLILLFLYGCIKFSSRISVDLGAKYEAYLIVGARGFETLTAASGMLRATPPLFRAIRSALITRNKDDYRSRRCC